MIDWGNGNGVNDVFFMLNDDFLKRFKWKQPDWGPLGYVTYKRTYSRDLGNGKSEEYWQTIKRVVEGVFTIQKKHCARNRLPWSERKARGSAEKMFQLMWEFKFTPPGRGLWMMGTPYVLKNGGASLNNCAFCSTEHITVDFAEPFAFLMDMSMLGVGVGADTKGASKFTIREPKYDDETLVVADTREGWVNLLKTYLKAYSGEGKLPKAVDYTKVRPLGEPIRGFGGVASGPGPLMTMCDEIQIMLDKRVGKKITSSDIVDIFNIIGKCVVSGNVRRTAEIMFGEPDDEEFAELKNPEKHPEEVKNHRWASNNSIFARVGMDYSKHAESTALNGEPGYEWLENAQNFSRMGRPPDGKDFRARGGNPCLEQTLEPYELCCVTGNTRIQTQEGVPKIKDVVGKEIKVWNGQRWSKVTPFKTSDNKPTYRVVLSDGSYLDVTDNHEWSVKKATERTFKKKTTLELEPGMYLPEFELKNMGVGTHKINAYSIGWFTGDGYMDKNRALVVVQQPEYEKVLPVLKGMQYKEQHPLFYKRPFRRVSLVGIVSEQLGKELRNYKKGLPEEIFKYDNESLSNFFGGWIDADGSLREQKNTDNYMLFGAEKKLRDAQLLLRRIGINHSTLSLMSPKGFETNKGIRNHDLYVLLIPSYECQFINTELKVATRFGSRYKSNNAYLKSNLIDAARKQKIVRVLIRPNNEPTYCFSEPEKHMGVFGNVLTHQCLVETYPSKHESLNEWLETLKFAYMYAKTVTLIPTHHKLTNSVLLRNRRIGCSISGITQAFKKFGRRELLRKCSTGYEKIQDWDRTYSDWLCIPRSIKTTSIKPSGTVSLLGGVTPGIHYPVSEYYIRNIRFQLGSPLLIDLKEAGYKIEKDHYSPHTFVVSFPVKEEFFDKSVEDVTMWEQLENAAQMQHYWADNQVSVTVSFSESEAKDIKSALELYENRLKGVSFLPKKGHGYVQAPYIPITKKEYNKMSESVTKLRFKGETHEVVDAFCDSDKCTIDITKRAK